MAVKVICYVNGIKTSRVSVFDRGLAYGDGCFTTALIINNQVQMLPQHLERLQMHCKRLGIANIDINALSATLGNVSAGVEVGVVKVMVTCGSGGRGYSRIGAQQPSVIVTLHDYPHLYTHWQEQGIHVGVSKQKLGINPMLAGLKHLNRLEQVLLRNELDQRPEDDLLVCDINGSIVECCSANVFWLKAGQWHTPSLTNAGVAGIMRSKILAMNPTIEPGEYTLAELDNIDAMFISNAILGIVPVNVFKQQTLDISLVKSMQKQCLTLENLYR
ncbi:4-amino-4-deoxychorismate lyase [Colwellia chukchiensis]|uniref:Aminodeoxychorismate lyase n=1 Tax=Colwellia chukchiensis TaxID=641665 RepID=A0A1H7M708_9GAMM|nr:aminodeoxychorismate lyase [Colwellia chukchiensis]SEL06879.1 4-amino-4-deoxychorismate lyase [Colwellia chukchiensis]